jgi:hypothetical protein
MENIRYEVWLQNQDKFVTQCDMNFIDPVFFRIRTMEFVMVLSPYFTSDYIFFNNMTINYLAFVFISSNLILSQRCKGDNLNELNKILH